MLTEVEKACSRCKQVLPATEFYPHMSARELSEYLKYRTQDVKDFMASMIVDHLDGVVGDAEWEKLTEEQADGADSIWGLQ